jgi:rubrerythrin
MVPAFLAAYVGWRLDVRARTGNCPTCNYDRRGIPAASVCPECGAAPAAPARAGT